MNCPSCGHANLDDARFCEECAGELARVCAGCRTTNTPTAKFCRQCRAPLTADSPEAPTPTSPSVMPPSPALLASFAGGRYQVQRIIGEGGRKRVYLAHDAKLDRDVAIAVIKTEGLDADGLTRVRREAQAMGRLGDHPHIVTIYDVGDDGGPGGQRQPYIVSQYMAGGAVDALEHPIALEQTLEIAKGVCRGLAYAHANGIVHRDLKPGNVWLAADGTAKIGDFGLAVALDRSRLTMAGMLVGTVAYMPPEQALGGDTTQRADLYSLGCMLYEMVTGRPPFVGNDPTAVISQHINQPPVAPSWLTESCPPELEEVILRMLAKDPGERPESAAAVLSALERVDPAQKSASHSESNVLDRLARGVFVGRERELDRLRKAFDEAFSGRGSMVMLVGEPGIGKTRAAQELETYARMRGAQVLWGRAHESSGAPAYWPWVQVGDAYNTARGLADLGPDTQGKGPELVRLFPWLRQGMNIGEPEQLADPEAAQFRFFDAYATFVRAMSNRTPLLIALDDLHWADKPSLLLLEYLARELTRLRVLIVCTYRDTDLSRTHPLSEALAALNREAGFQRVVLRGLSRGEVAGYIRAVANVTPRPELLDRIFEETEGNPFFLSEVVNLLTQEGKLTESISDIAVPDGVREALGRRLDRISEEANELLQVAAVVGREFAYDTLTLLGERDEDALLRLIEEAIEARVIEEMEQPGRYKFTHALMQETLLDELSTTRRVRIHGQVGEALERRWGARADERATRLALHFVEAAMVSPRHAAKAVHYAKLAAQQAEAQFAWDDAATHYEHCLTLIGDAADGLGEDEAALLVAMGICARNGGSPRPAWRSLMRAITLYRERDDGAGAARATLEALGIPAAIDRYVPLVRDALETLASGDPYLEARLLSFVVDYSGAFQMTPQEAANAEQRLLQLIDAHNFEDVRALRVASEAAKAYSEGAFERAAELAAEVYERFAALGQVRLAANQLMARATSLLTAGLLDQGREAAEEALAHARRHRLVYFERIAADLAGSVLLARCDFEAFDRASEDRGADTSYLMDLLRATRAEMAGSSERAVAALPDPAGVGGQKAFLTHVHAGRARVLSNAGRERAAQDDYRRMREALRGMPWARVSNGIAVHPFALGLDEAVTALGDDAFARAMYEMGPAAGTYDFGSVHSVKRVLGAIALHLGEIDAAEERFREGLAWCERERCPIEAGRCLQGLAEVSERRGERAEALQLLDRAAALFQQHGAKLYLDRVITKKLELQGISSSDIHTSIDAVAASVERERPEISVHPAPDGTVTIMFSDIEGSTEKTERLGDKVWMEVLKEHNAIVRRSLKAHGGFEVKIQGDGFMVAFQSARRALDCAIDIQRALAARNNGGVEPIKLRMGLHTGEAIKEGEDFFGKHVNLAARVASQAKGGEILVSSLLKELTESAGEFTFGERRKVELKGLRRKHSLFDVVWESA
jgi:eukaryotic-like serine/threonine-protein kinase